MPPSHRDATLHGLQNPLLGFFAEAGQSADLAGLRGLQQLLEVFDMQVLIERSHAPGSERRNLQELRDRGRQLAVQLLEKLAGARMQDIHDLLGQIRADAGNTR